MYYEECVIDGVLHWRGTPTGTWRPCTPERLSFLLTEARTELQSEKARADAAERDAELWRKHKDSFAVLQAVLDAASPLVLNRLKAQEATIEATHD